MKPLQRVVAAMACLSMIGAGLPLPAHAALVGTEQVLGAGDASAARTKIATWLARDDVRQVLSQAGVEAGQVQQRVDALTDREARDLAARIDQLPAGGDVLGVLFAVFIILLITDIFGLTKVFPFTRPVR